MIEVRESDLVTALEVLDKLSEFDALKPLAHYQQVLEGKKQLILCAYHQDKAVACKIGYDRFEDGSFYSWLGGVVPEYRKMGTAKLLADHQEKWARENGFISIKFKTQNRHKAMLQFALGNGFSIYNVKPKQELEQYRIELIKTLI